MLAILRMLVILVATFAAVMFAWRAAAFVPVAPDLFLSVDEAFARLVAPVEDFVLRPLLALARGWGYDLVLLPHWKYVLILTWLFATAVERMLYRWPGAWRTNLFWGGASALIAGTLAGIVPPNDTRIIFAIAAGLALSNLAAWAREAAADRVVREFGIWDAFTYVALIAILFLLHPDLPLLPRCEIGSDGEVFGRLTFYWAYAGLLLTIVGMFDTLADGPWWQRWRTSPVARGGIDLLAVALGASALISPAILARIV